MTVTCGVVLCFNSQCIMFQRIALARNHIVTVTCGVVAVMYLLMVVLARRWDRLDRCRVGVLPLCGKNGRFKYELTIVTGMQFGAGKTWRFVFYVMQTLVRGYHAHHAIVFTCTVGLNP